jgi:phage terminase large subunit GpA-like protein
LHKRFPGGHLTVVGANSPASLASRPIRVVLADEVDCYPVSAGAEGGPLNLALKRPTMFRNSPLVIFSARAGWRVLDLPREFGEGASGKP